MKNMDFLYENITNKIIKMLEEGNAPWRKTWKASDLPMNLTTKIPYHGINVWTLLSSPHATSRYWLTGRQVLNAKGRIKDTETKNYETIIFWKQLKYTKKNEDGDDIEKRFPLVLYTRVYNLGQCEFNQEILDKLVPKENKTDFVPLEKCEQVVAGYETCPEIRYGGNKAFFSPLMDKIQMPIKESFECPEAFYATLFHEMAHSTGTEKRLNRFKATDTAMFGSETYSKEELVAEMTSSFLCAETAIENKTIENSVSYIKGWLQAIKNSDRYFVVSAASKASYAANYILGKTNKQSK